MFSRNNLTTFSSLLWYVGMWYAYVWATRVKNVSIFILMKYFWMVLYSKRCSRFVFSSYDLINYQLTGCEMIRISALKALKDIVCFLLLLFLFLFYGSYRHNFERSVKLWCCRTRDSFWFTNSSDYRRVWTANPLDKM